MVVQKTVIPTNFTAMRIKSVLKGIKCSTGKKIVQSETMSQSAQLNSQVDARERNSLAVTALVFHQILSAMEQETALMDRMKIMVIAPYSVQVKREPV